MFHKASLQISLYTDLENTQKLRDDNDQSEKFQIIILHMENHPFEAH
jgi:hypothetical protein